ncbi:hypothetical protein QOT17_006070 [Balamuthia mandrillaris]
MTALRWRRSRVSYVTLWMVLILSFCIVAFLGHGLLPNETGSYPASSPLAREATATELSLPNSNLYSNGKPSLYPRKATQQDNAQSRVWLILNTIILPNTPLYLPYYLTHYQQLGLDFRYSYIIVIATEELEGERKEIYQQMVNILDQYGAYHELFTNLTGENHDFISRLTSNRGVREQDWVLHTDVDELHEWMTGYKIVEEGGEVKQRRQTVPEFLLETVDKTDFTHVVGHFMDRVAADGTLLPILPWTEGGASLWQQFPLGCQVTKVVTRGTVQKVLAFRGSYKVNNGQHTLMLKESVVECCQTTAWPEVMTVHHFKFIKGVPEVLKERRKKNKYNFSAVYKAENKRMLQHFWDHADKICVGCPELECKHLGGPPSY